MRTLFHVVVSEHQRLRDLLRGMLLLAVRAEEGDVHAWYELTQRDLKRELELHAQRERHEMARLFPGDDPFARDQRHKLDALHEVEARAAILLRVATDLADGVLHIGEIVEALADEERDLMTAEELLDGPAAASERLAEALAQRSHP
jgi:hypothetical protein